MDTVDKVIENYGINYSRNNIQVVLPQRKDLSDRVEIVNIDAKKIFFNEIYFVDGIQSCILIKYENYHPIYLIKIVAGAIGKDNLVTNKDEVTKVISAELNKESLKELFAENELHFIDSSDPHDTTIFTEKIIANMRGELEMNVVKNVSDREPNSLIVLDGSICNLPAQVNIVGVVKSTNSKYLKNENEIFSLAEGEISKIFSIDKHSEGDNKVLYSCYLRLFTNNEMAWNYGLVRLESYFPENLKEVAKIVFDYRQDNPYKDIRGDRHLAPIKNLEDILKYELPYIL